MPETNDESPVGKNSNNQTLTRRQFLINSAKLMVGAAIGFSTDFSKSKIQIQGKSELHSNSEEHKTIINESYIEDNQVKTLVFADKICFYSNAPFADADGGILPKNNDQFYHNRQAELLGFVYKPNFLILHTAGGRDMKSIIQNLNERNIHCQFLVGNINGETVSVQSTYLKKNRVNVTGTVAGGEENPYEANIQYWGSLNIEIGGTPEEVDPSLIDKTVQLCLGVMPVYRLKTSQLIGHMEVPNNGKPDPGRNVLKEIRTKVYLGLLEKGFLDLIDIYPDNTDVLSNFFVIGRDLSGPAELNSEGRVKCWLRNEDSYIDWDRIVSFLTDNPELANKLRGFREGTIQIVSIEQKNKCELDEMYMGFPPSFADWLRLPTKPLGSEEFSKYRPNGTANFVYRVRNIISDNSTLIGSNLPFSYGSAQNLARMFISEQPYGNRGGELSEAMVAIAENIGDINFSWNKVKIAYQQKFGSSVV